MRIGNNGHLNFQNTQPRVDKNDSNAARKESAEQETRPEPSALEQSSDVKRLLERLRDSKDDRSELLSKVKANLAENKYGSQDSLQAVAEAFLDTLPRQPLVDQGPSQQQ